MLSVHQLSLHHFRNYASVTLEAGGRSVILTGPNGAGKTNLLEALSLLVPGRGMRKCRLSALSARPGDAGWVVAAQVEGFDGRVQIGTALDEQAGGEKRLVRLDGFPAKSQTVLAEHLAISWQTPQMDGLFLDSQGARRRFLDRLVYQSDTAHLSRVARYEHAMRERNKLLAQPTVADAAWLSALEETMAQHAVAIAVARAALLDRLNRVLAQQEGAFPKALLRLDGELEQLLERQSASEAELSLARLLAENRPRDRAAGRTLSGAHRSELIVLHDAKQMEAAYCSTGEQKALLLSILLAHALVRKQWRGQAPLLLLDEVVAHLDQTRRAALAEALEALQTQVWLTGTDAADFRAFQHMARHFSVHNGALQPSE